eukprot:385975-Pyramimonas_sp.AAC.1
MDTRRAFVHNVTDHAARLDRTCGSLPSAIIAEMSITASTIGRRKIDMPSDRAPVASNISTPDQS